MPRRISVDFVALAAGFLMLAASPLRADVPGYQIQTLARSGDTLAGVKIATGGYFELGTLNDSGQIAFDFLNAAGGETVFQYSGGQFLPVAVGAQTVSGVTWPRGVIFDGNVSMNQQGDMAFRTITPTSNTYRWDHQSGQVSLVATKAMPAVNDLTFTAGADNSPPAINDSGEVAFQAPVKGSAGTTQRGIFLLGRDGKLAPVALPGDMVAGIGAIQPDSTGGMTSLNNTGVVAFDARRPGDKSDGVFLWENGTITSVALPGADAPGGGTFKLVGGGLVNDKNRNVLLAGNLDGNSSHWGLYMWTGDHLVAICVPGQTTMPGGGQFLGLSNFSHASSAGVSAFTARLAGGDSGVYRVDADGKLSLVVRSSDLGAQVVFPNGSNTFGITINAKGQIALPLIFTGDKHVSLALLTPNGP